MSDLTRELRAIRADLASLTRRVADIKDECFWYCGACRCQPCECEPSETAATSESPEPGWWKDERVCKEFHELFIDDVFKEWNWNDICDAERAAAIALADAIIADYDPWSHGRARCGECGLPLMPVRPGNWQCECCPQIEAARAEAFEEAAKIVAEHGIGMSVHARNILVNAIRSRKERGQ